MIWGIETQSYVTRNLMLYMQSSFPQTRKDVKADLEHVNECSWIKEEIDTEK